MAVGVRHAVTARDCTYSYFLHLVFMYYLVLLYYCFTGLPMCAINSCLIFLNDVRDHMVGIPCCTKNSLQWGSNVPESSRPTQEILGRCLRRC